MSKWVYQSVEGKGFLNVVLDVFQFWAMPAVEEAVHPGQEDADAVPKLCLFWGPVLLLLLQVYVLGQLHNHNGEADDGESPYVFNGVEERTLGLFDVDDTVSESEDSPS